MNERLSSQIAHATELLSRILLEQARQSPRFQDARRLLAGGFKAYSQFDEDGIIEEIFNRIGTTNRFFVEFGSGDGLENCTTYCLLKGWTGAWIDGAEESYTSVQQRLAHAVDSGNIRMLCDFITAENIESLFARLDVPTEFDLLSIDIDRNDYWVWKAIERYHPRVVVIEYNASLKAKVACTVPYRADEVWDRYSNNFGASLKALEYLGREKGYSLVGCSFSGVNAFFVRQDCVGDHFCEPFTSENHYEPARYTLLMTNGHAPTFPEVVHIPEPNEAR